MAEGLSDKPWSGDASNYEDANAYCEACLVDLNEPGAKKIKGNCHLPVKEPGGAYNRVGMGSAAAALAGGRGHAPKIPASAKKSAARKLAGLYRRFKLDVPPVVQRMAM